MIDRFTMNRYYNQYIEAVTAMNRASERLKLAKETAIYSADVEAAYSRIAEREAEYQAAKEKVDDLWYLWHYGMHKSEVNAPRPQSKLKFNTGWNGRADRHSERKR